MNNSFIAIESVTLAEEPVDNTGLLRTKEAELIALIEPLEKIANSQEWNALKEKLWDLEVARLLKQREQEVEKKPLNGPLIHSINGQLAWAKIFLNLSGLVNKYKAELDNVRKQLNAT